MTDAWYGKLETILPPEALGRRTPQHSEAQFKVFRACARTLIITDYGRPILQIQTKTARKKKSDKEIRKGGTKLSHQNEPIRQETKLTH